MHGILATLRYKHSVHQRLVLLVVILLVALFALYMILPQFIQMQYVFNDYSDGGVFGLLLIIFLITFAHGDTTYLCSRPLTRRSIWLGAMAYILVYAVALATIRLLLALFGYGLVHALAPRFPNQYALSPATAWGAFDPSRSLTVWRDAFLGLLAAGLVAYAYGTLLRRWRGWTIALTILIPLLSISLTVMPVVYLFINDMESLVQSNDVSAMLQVLPGWLALIQRVVEWFVKYYDVVFWSVVATSVPVGFLTMRTTPQA